MTAVAGATLVSGYMGSKSADKASDKASEASEAQLAFEQRRYDDWNAVYGPLQDNLSQYYQNVTPDYYASVGLETFQEQYQTGLQRLEENLVQRGIDPTSGIAASLEAQAELGAAETKASIRREAPRKAMEDQSRFLQIGLGQNPASSVGSALSQQTQLANQQSAYANQAAGDAWAAAIPAVGRAIDAYNTPETEGQVISGNPRNQSNYGTRLS